MATLLPLLPLHSLLLVLLYAAEAGLACYGELLQQFGDAVATLAMMLWQRDWGCASPAVAAQRDTAALTDELQAGRSGSA
jgi:hypothetical protein